MFDTIYLQKPIACRTCGADILDFQTKEFDNLMDHYRIGSVVSGSRVLSGIIKGEAYCEACSKAKRNAWTDIYLVIWHTILAGVETEESKAEALLASVDRMNLVEWLAEAQKKEVQWQKRFYSLHDDLSRWHRYLEEQKKPQEPETEDNKRLRILWSIWGPPEEIKTATDSDCKNIGIAQTQKRRGGAGIVLNAKNGFLDRRTK